MASTKRVSMSSASTWPSVWAARVQRRQNADGKRLDELKALTPDAFEEWVAQRFRERGYRVELAGAQGDHGIDLVISREGELAVVQCKNYRAWSVGEPVLRDLFGAMHAVQADRAYLVTSGRLTAPAVAWAAGKPIEIWDEKSLVEVAVMVPDNRPQVGEPRSLDASTCPRCGSSMVVRKNRSSGEEFLGCSGFPACRQTLRRTT
jgi:restriction system protein